MKQLKNPNRTDVWIVLAAMAIGLALRCWRLGSSSLWLDESFTLRYLAVPFFKIAPMLENFSVHPPLYFFLLKPWSYLGGDHPSEIWFRFPSVVFSVLAIPVVGKITTEIFGRTAGLYSCVLMALSAIQIRYAQEARMYSMMVFLGTLSFWSLLQLTKKPTESARISYSAASIALTYTHVFGVFSVLGHSAYFLLKSAHERRAGREPALSTKGWLKIQAFIAAAFLPWVASLLHQVRSTTRYDWISKSPVGRLNRFFEWTSFFGSGTLTTLTLILAGISTVSIFISWKKKPKIEIFFLLTWFTTPVLISWIVAMIHMKIASPRYFLLSSVPIMVLASGALAEVKRNRFLHLSLIVIILTVSGHAIGRYFYQFAKPNWRGLVQYLKAEQRNDDAIILSPLYDHLFRYYMGPKFNRESIVRLLPGINVITLDASEADKKIMQVAFQGRRFTWLTLPYNSPEYGSLPAEPDLMLHARALMSQKYNLIEAKNFYGVLLLKFEAKEPVTSL
jgi:uncharacterized membrane protein